MKVVSSRTLELRSALPQIWKEKKDSVNNATMSSGKLSTSAPPPPPPPHSFTHQTLLNVGYLKCCPFWLQQCMARQFHQSFTQIGYIMHSLTWYSRSLRKLVGSDHSFVGFPCPPRDNRTATFWGLFHEMLLRVWFFLRIPWNLFTGAFFSFPFQFCDGSKLVIIHMKI
jgi:hypothetical protein